MRCQGGDEQVIDDFFWEGACKREVLWAVGAPFLAKGLGDTDLRGHVLRFRVHIRMWFSVVVSSLVTRPGLVSQAEPTLSPKPHNPTLSPIPSTLSPKP